MRECIPLSLTPSLPVVLLGSAAQALPTCGQGSDGEEPVTVPELYLSVCDAEAPLSWDAS